MDCDNTCCLTPTQAEDENDAGAARSWTDFDQTAEADFGI